MAGSATDALRAGLCASRLVFLQTVFWNSQSLRGKGKAGMQNSFTQCFTASGVYGSVLKLVTSVIWLTRDNIGPEAFKHTWKEVRRTTFGFGSSKSHTRYSQSRKISFLLRCLQGKGILAPWEFFCET